MKLDKLGDDARAMLRFVSENYPEWASSAINEPDEKDFYLEVPSPNDPGVKLEIFSRGDELTIQLDYIHGHFGINTDEQVRAKQYIDDIINNRVLAVSMFKKGKWAWSEMVDFSGLRYSEMIRK
jgi:hypothetical protein